MNVMLLFSSAFVFYSSWCPFSGFKQYKQLVKVIFEYNSQNYSSVKLWVNIFTLKCKRPKIHLIYHVLFNAFIDMKLLLQKNMFVLIINHSGSAHKSEIGVSWDVIFKLSSLSHFKMVHMHPAARFINVDWFISRFMMVLFEMFFSV